MSRKILVQFCQILLIAFLQCVIWRGEALAISCEELMTAVRSESNNWKSIIYRRIEQDQYETSFRPRGYENCEVNYSTFNYYTLDCRRIVDSIEEAYERAKGTANDIAQCVSKNGIGVGKVKRKILPEKVLTKSTLSLKKDMYSILVEEVNLCISVTGGGTKRSNKENLFVDVVISQDADGCR